MREFLLICAAAAGGMVLGGLFGRAVGATAPELISIICRPQTITDPVGVATALGAINGLLLGAAAMGLGLFIAALRSRAVHDD